MIEVRCYPSGDVAYADDPESALLAAVTLCADDRAAVPLLGRERSASFFVDGALVRGPVPERALWVAS